jgi:hypothetical protein
MGFTRVILIFVGLWFLRLLYRQITGSVRNSARARRQTPESRQQDKGRSAPFEEGKIVDAEFEELDDGPGPKS